MNRRVRRRIATHAPLLRNRSTSPLAPPPRRRERALSQLLERDSKALHRLLLRPPPPNRHQPRCPRPHRVPPSPPPRETSSRPAVVLRASHHLEGPALAPPRTAALHRAWVVVNVPRRVIISTSIDMSRRCTRVPARAASDARLQARCERSASRRLLRLRRLTPPRAVVALAVAHRPRAVSPRVV